MEVSDTTSPHIENVYVAVCGWCNWKDSHVFLASELAEGHAREHIKAAHPVQAEWFETIERLQTDNAELKAHIERWAEYEERTFGFVDKHTEAADVEGTAVGFCSVCKYGWPCPTEVAKGWKE